MNIVGISAYSHESACCLLRDGELAAAAEEERFTRIKRDARMPTEAFRYCLEAARLDITDIDLLAYYETPRKKLERQLWSTVPPGVDAEWLDAGRVERAIRETLGYDGEVLYAEHHASHAASAFFYSGFPDAAILTVDGVGEWATTSYGRGGPAGIEIFEEVRFPHSLGLFYSMITSFLGFRVNDGEYKVMGLAPYGEPTYVDELSRVLKSASGAHYELDLTYFDFLRGTRMFSTAFVELIGVGPRKAGDDFASPYRNLARSAQVVLEQMLLDQVRYLRARTGSPNLCMAGGVALNAVANGRIRREGPFARLFIPPAPGDAGAALGAAAIACFQRDRGVRLPLTDAALGPSHSHDDIRDVVAATGLPFEDHHEDERALLERVADAIAHGKIVGWFHGRMEFGPRALGSRSILADPRDASITDRLNRLVKRRERFRPFAPSVLLGDAARHFTLDGPSPFMLDVCPVISPLTLPAITHVDGTARPQTVDPFVQPRFARLLQAFRARTGCPMLVNTSFNVADEPIVCSPVDAILTMAISGLDLLVLEDWVLERGDAVESLARVVSEWGSTRAPRTINDVMYTFV